MQAFRHIVDVERSQNLSNVAYVFHAWGYGSSFGQSTIDAWYPGDDYVDWVAVSAFAGWESASAFGQVKALALEQFAERHHKPFMIADLGRAGIR